MYPIADRAVPTSLSLSATHSMPYRLVLLSFTLLLLPRSASAQAWQEQPDWARLFVEAGVPGTIAVFDERTQRHAASDTARARRRFLPASTFKVPHLLFALDAGIVTDEFQRFTWDSVPRTFASWNRDHDTRSSMRASVVWVYQGFARELGEAREREYMQRIGYGNGDVSGGVERFWLDGGLRISAEEQIAFLRRLHRNALPFRTDHQRLVKDVMIVEAGRDWILRGKTGWAFDVDPQIGWYVGWLERPEGAVFFALNIHMPAGGADAAKREAIVRTVLQSLGALPAP